MADRGGGSGPERPIRILKERVGGMRPEVKERRKRHRGLRRAIRAALAEAPRTVPELAAGIGAPAHETLWMLMAMKKYGEIVEGEERDGYHAYALAPGEAVR